MKNFWIMCLLTLPACTSSPTRYQDIGFYSALCPKPVVSFHQEYSEADQAFFRMLESVMPVPSPNDIVIVPDHFDMHQLAEAMLKVTPGGFLFVLSFDPRVYRVMKERRWFRLPFLYSDFEIYRKPLAASA